MMDGSSETANADKDVSMVDKGKQLWANMVKGDAPLAIGTEGKADCPSCTKEIDFTQYSNQRGDEINAGNPFSCPHCSQLLLRWEPDSAVSNCNDCKDKFFSFRSWNDIVRKDLTLSGGQHHCRMCGKIYCSECLTLCRVAGFGWEVHGNWIKLKLCKCCETTNKEKNDAMQQAQNKEEAAPAEAEASAANVTAEPEPAPLSEAVAALKVEEPKKKAKAPKKKPTSMFDDDISFIQPASGGAAADKPKKEKKKKPAALNMFDGGEGTPEKDSLFD